MPWVGSVLVRRLRDQSYRGLREVRYLVSARENLTSLKVISGEPEFLIRSTCLFSLVCVLSEIAEDSIVKI
jgi:hypothetical protein